MSAARTTAAAAIKKRRPAQALARSEIVMRLVTRYVP
jgi:hypothetical protein